MNRETFRVATINISNDSSNLFARYQLLFEKLQPISPHFLLIQEVIDPEMMESLLKKHKFDYVTLSERSPDLHKNDCLIVGSKIKHKFLQETDSFAYDQQRRSLYVSTRVKGRKIALVTSHFAWGSTAEGIRLRQAEEITGHAQRFIDSAYDAVILGGDLNADENSRTVRYLQGVDLASDNLSSTYWTDAYIAGEGTENNWATTDQGSSELGRATARRFGITYPEMLPQRRIDYIFSYGWRYGKVGCPTGYRRFGKRPGRNDLELSDHFGIYADILV